MRRGQWVLAIGAVGLVIALYFAGRTTGAGSSEKPAQIPEISWKSIEDQAIAQLSTVAKDSLSRLEKTWSEADTSHSSEHLSDLVLFWLVHDQKPVAAYKIYQHAEKMNTPAAWSDAGDAFSDALKSHADSVISNKMLTFALQSYEKVLVLRPGDVNTRIKMAEIYVQGPEPMKGIGMLRSIVDSLPDNVPALIALGRLSLQSGQYDKAIGRLEDALKLEPQNTEALYFLAIAEAESGNAARAIELLELCKKLVGNPEFDKEIDVFIQELKNKNV